jgi:hypothetical protein
MDTEIISLLWGHDLDIAAPPRLLLASSPVAGTVPAWKAALWDSSTVEPAMLRAPFVVIMFIFLWGFNILFFEKIRLQYYSALSIKTGKA